MNPIKKIFGKAVVVRPIADQRIYEDNFNSYCGNSLADSNVLLLTNCKEWMQAYEDQLRKENCYFTLVENPLEDDLTQQKLVEYSNDLIGPYRHIINLYRVSDDSNFVQHLYTTLQKESDYLINSVNYGTICTAVVWDETLSDIARASIGGITSLVKGLGYVLPKHGIIENGISAKSDVPIEQIMHGTIFLSGKYGNVLTGEVLNLSGSES
jgi:hypothetical protein